MTAGIKTGQRLGPYERKQKRSNAPWTDTHLLILIDGLSRLRTHPQIATNLATHPAGRPDADARTISQYIYQAKGVFELLRTHHRLHELDEEEMRRIETWYHTPGKTQKSRSFSAGYAAAPSSFTPVERGPSEGSVHASVQQGRPSAEKVLEMHAEQKRIIKQQIIAGEPPAIIAAIVRQKTGIPATEASVRDFLRMRGGVVEFLRGTHSAKVAEEIAARWKEKTAKREVGSRAQRVG